MIGFIIIGRNEGAKLVNCIKSIFGFITSNGVQKSEIIYVDSQSADNSIELVKQFSEVRVFQITGKMNAAIGRNIGAENSKADILFFIDGDMEIHADFYPKAFINESELQYPFISGKFVNYYYKDGEFLYKEVYKASTSDRYETTTGGLFIIERKLWDKVGGMRTKFKTGEDLDLGLRLAKKGVLLLRKVDVLADHHTINYKDNERMWNMLFKGLSSYSRGLLYRHHLLNKYIYPRVVGSDGSAVLLVLCIILTAAFKMAAPALIYPLFIILAAYYKKFSKNILSIVFVHLPYLFIRDLITIGSFLFFYPKNAKTYQYIEK